MTIRVLKKVSGTLMRATVKEYMTTEAKRLAADREDMKVLEEIERVCQLKKDSKSRTKKHRRLSSK